MNPFEIIEQTWWLGIPIAFLGGAMLGFNPLALPVMGTAVGLGASGTFGTKGAGVRMVAAFGAGMTLVYTLVGAAASQIDFVIEKVLRPYSGIGYVVLAVMMLGLGAWILFRPSAFCLSCAKPSIKSPTLVGAFLAGIPGGFVNCPACAAVITGVAASSAALGSPIYSSAVMMALGVGHAGVLVGLTWFLTRGLLPTGGGKMVVFQKVSAILLLALAGYFVYLGLQSGVAPGPRLP